MKLKNSTALSALPTIIGALGQSFIAAPIIKVDELKKKKGKGHKHIFLHPQNIAVIIPNER